MTTITDKRYPLLEVRKSRIQGLGCFAIKMIPKGSRIAEYSGPRLNKEETLQALRNVNEYVFTLDSKWSVDGSVLSNFARYVNHSCDPNCESDIEDGRIWIDAMRDIQKGEEITVNYTYEFNNFSKRVCKCGAKKCLGYMVSENHSKRLDAMIDLANQIAFKK